MTDLEKQAQQKVQNMMKVNARNAIDDMAIAISLSITKDGKYFGAIASQYLEWMNKYSQFCSDSSKEQWCNTIYNILCSGDEEKRDERVAVLECYEKAGELMEKLSNSSLESVASEYLKTAKDEGTRDFVELLVLLYSSVGMEFLEMVETPNDKQKKANLKEEYDRQKKGDNGMKITENTTVEEVREATMTTFAAMCDAQSEQKSGMRKAEDVMDEFMEKLNNDEFPKDTEPHANDNGFDPTNEEEAERILAGFSNLLEEIKELKLK